MILLFSKSVLCGWRKELVYLVHFHCIISFEPVFGNFWIGPTVFRHSSQYESIAAAAAKGQSTSLLYLQITIIEMYLITSLQPESFSKEMNSICCVFRYMKHQMPFIQLNDTAKAPRSEANADKVLRMVFSSEILWYWKSYTDGWMVLHVAICADRTEQYECLENL